MPKVLHWANMPVAVRKHLAQRLLDRDISLDDLAILRNWIDSNPEVPAGEWFKDFGSFKLCGEGSLPKTFLTKRQVGKGQSI